MSDVVIKVEDVSKQYRLGKIGTGSLRHDLNRWWYLMRGKEDPYLKIGEVNDPTKKGESQYVWALKDINFEVKRGEVLGIIGRNGAGKSTLLKILSRTTLPTTGQIKTRGRIASLLEVGTGFHPELTGRENIFLNGAILGMRKAEIQRKLDEIIDFSGVERYIDTPVKRYSSGMYVRLAFAVAAHLESEILIVDEVLAVGDTEFQKKCLGKMGEVSKGDGRTVLFVSHNMVAIENLCDSGILLRQGGIIFKGLVEKSINYYLKMNSSELVLENKIETQYGNIVFSLKNYEGDLINRLRVGEAVTFNFEFLSFRRIEIANLGIGINNRANLRVVTFHTMFQATKAMSIESGTKIVCRVDTLNLMPGEYVIEISIFENNQTIYNNQEIFIVEIIEDDFFKTGKLPNIQKQGLILMNGLWFENGNSL